MEEAFEGIVRDYQDKIFRLAFSLMGERAAAEEIAQDVLVRVWKGLPGFRGASSLSTWIYSITRNCCLSALHRAPPRTVSLDDAAPRHAAERHAAAAWSIPEPPGAAALLNRLPARYRAAAALFYMEDQSYEEVSRLLDLPLGTVKTYLFQARKMLAEELVRERVPKGGA
jgi:RNA polymerase sigma-70 factor (ECF subfamily)